MDAWVQVAKEQTARAERAEAELAEARAKLDKPCGECHPCMNWPAETWRRSGARLPDVHEWNAVVAERERVRQAERKLWEQVAQLKALYSPDGSDRFDAGRLVALQEAHGDLLAALDGTDNTGGTE